MNIFVLDHDPVRAARDQCDRHVVKMVLESAQMLSTVCFKHGAPAPLKPTHPNHPCTLWAGACAENYEWLWHHMGALLQEYHRRYGRIHAMQKLHGQLWEQRPVLPHCGAVSAFAQAMPEVYKVPGDAVSAYRRYYMGEKSTFAKWKHCEAPGWYRPEAFRAEFATTDAE